jgi:hypothetical protein
MKRLCLTCKNKRCLHLCNFQPQPRQPQKTPQLNGMGTCRNCRPDALSSLMPAQLFQIRRGYRAQWNNLTLPVENQSGDWTLCIRDSARGETLYTAQRSGVGAAQVAAVEFAACHELGPMSPVNARSLAGELKRQEYW